MLFSWSWGISMAGLAQISDNANQDACQLPDGRLLPRIKALPCLGGLFDGWIAIYGSKIWQSMIATVNRKNGPNLKWRPVCHPGWNPRRKKTGGVAPTRNHAR
ncbi:hypothetical protein [Ferribacterium limneticum]|uniref:hypothetical protein n=1 Tax=Ferribacterium limneticum TaxID=76259 RepID=UPI001CF9D65A|nr:hypothetical protein [Ferribacterium limneticum]UCV17177.1 hypothetical protein KI610_09930 [Ferribacterium limneticum]